MLIINYMKYYNQEKDGEELPIYPHEKSNGKIHKKNTSLENFKNNLYSKKSIIMIIILLLIIVILFKLNSKYNSLKENFEKIDERIELLESQIKHIAENKHKRKIGVAVVVSSLYGNGIGRFISVLTELLAKTGKYVVYLIVEQVTIMDFPYYKDVIRIVQKKDEKEVAEWDKIHNVDIYILNNDISGYLETYKSLGKKVIGIFHGIFLSCIFTNHTLIYQQWYRFDLFDAFVQIIPDDYYIYKRLNFENEIFIPNLYTFDHTNTPTSSLTTNNVLIVGRTDDVIKGTKYGIKAMAEVIKNYPKANLNIVSGNHGLDIKDLVKELNIESNVNFLPFTHNISEAYLNASVLLVSSLSESFPMVMNEGKAHGLPVVAFNVEYSPCFQKGVITVDMFDYKAMGKEIEKLLRDFNYRKKKGMEAKYSLDMFKNNETINMWGDLFTALMKGDKEYRKLQKKVEDKYYNEDLAKYRMEKHYKFAQDFNKIVSCHSFEQFTNVEYLKKVYECPIKDGNGDNL